MGAELFCENGGQSSLSSGGTQEPQKTRSLFPVLQAVGIALSPTERRASLIYRAIVSVPVQAGTMQGLFPASTWLSLCLKTDLCVLSTLSQRKAQWLGNYHAGETVLENDEKTGSLSNPFQGLHLCAAQCKAVSRY